MLCFLALIAPLYLGLVWLVARFACREPAHRPSHLIAAGAAVPAAGIVGLLGVPFVDDGSDAVLWCAIGLLAFAPAVLPLHRFRAAIVAGLAALVLYAVPFVRAERLTATLGEALRVAFAREHPGAPGARYFGVIDQDGDRVRVLRVDEEGGYYVAFERAADGTWRVQPGAYPPQVLAWYEGSSGRTDCPYPVPLLLIARGIRSGCSF